jgi:hypothetical protein
MKYLLLTVVVLAAGCETKNQWGIRPVLRVDLNGPHSTQISLTWEAKDPPDLILHRTVAVLCAGMNKFRVMRVYTYEKAFPQDKRYVIDRLMKLAQDKGLVFELVSPHNDSRPEDIPREPAQNPFEVTHPPDDSGRPEVPLAPGAPRWEDQSGR